MADGGSTKNDWCMQYQTDLLGFSVIRSDIAERSVPGAALPAQKALIIHLLQNVVGFCPSISAMDIYRNAGVNGKMLLNARSGNLV